MPVNADLICNRPFEPVVEDYDQSRTILYALGVGAGMSAAELDLVYEKDLKTLPAMATTLAQDPLWMLDPATGITMTHVLHGEQGLEVHSPLPKSGTVKAQTHIDALFDKGDKGAVMLMRRELTDAANGQRLVTTRNSVFMRADGNFGGTTDGQPRPHPIPDRAADLIQEVATRPDQALIYRLSGDYNPLHVDVGLARAAGFERPILHGLCTYGIVSRELIAELCAADPTRLIRFDARFSSPVFPGDTLTVELWHDAPGKGSFRVGVANRGVTVLNNGRIDYRAQ